MGGSPRPPVWAETALRCLLPPRNRDTVSGDLLEEYREVVVPGRGVVRANLWYLRQVVSFVTPALTRSKREASMRWIVFGTVSLAVVLVALVRSNLAPPAGLMVAVPLALVLALTALPSMRSRAELLPMLRIAAWGGGLVLAVLVFERPSKCWPRWMCWIGFLRRPGPISPSSTTRGGGSPRWPSRSSWAEPGSGRHAAPVEWERASSPPWEPVSSAPRPTCSSPRSPTCCRWGRPTRGPHPAGRAVPRERAHDVDAGARNPEHRARGHRRAVRTRVVALRFAAG